MNNIKLPKRVLVLGSGALKIGQAGEFDFSGSQCLKALREEGIKTVLVNPNIATIQTSEGMADSVYFLPVQPHFIEEIIKKEKVDSIFLSFGGQTALNCGIDLQKSGFLKRHGVRVLGTSVETIDITEDRDKFVKALNQIGVKTPASLAVSSAGEALRAAEKIGYPVMVRAAFALGGQGSGAAKGKKELQDLAEKALSSSPQILVEEYLGGWKEIEYEVVRDQADNCITVCNMENMDPLGIHTGESIVVAPAQTLNNHEYFKLREIAIKVIRHLKIVGECNIQYALDPKSDDYRVIEVNARLSRSSALASKATGYPLAFIAAKLGLGFNLPELKNSVTGVTTACFEPALDYLVVKIPRWDLHKFKKVSQEIGSEMKSVGEVMAIGRTFAEAIQKGVRMLDIGADGIVGNSNHAVEDAAQTIKNPTDRRIFALAQAFGEGKSVETLHAWSKIDKWFLHKIKNIVDLERELKKEKLDKELILKAKQSGFSDKQIARSRGKNEEDIRQLRTKFKIHPVVKQIDTLGGEYPAKTNYLYLTYNGTAHDPSFRQKKSVIVLGSGAYRIGSSVEFDWCCVNAIKTSRSLGYNTIMINYNPETVSTDYDECDRLYFDELSFEVVQEIYNLEKPEGVIVSMGGQVPNNLALKLYKNKIKVLGTSPLSIDKAEDRHKFSGMLDKLNIDQPKWRELKSINQAKEFAKKADYPVLIRPSYVLSGAAMNVVFDDESLERYLNMAAKVNEEHPVVISKFIENAREIEIDAVAKGGEIVVYAISEHVENAGVHSGDATMVLPPQKTYLETFRRVRRIARTLARELNITGPFNIQFLAKNNDIKVIECNLRASRSFPFCSKVYKINFIDMATRVILNEDIPKIDKSSLDLDYVGVKASQFSFSRLKGADPVSTVEMASTGEVGCLGEDMYEAFLKAVLSVGLTLPPKDKYVLMTLSERSKGHRMLDVAQQIINLGYKVLATERSHEFFAKNGIKTKLIHKIHQPASPNIKNYLTERKIGLIISIPSGISAQEKTDADVIRRQAVEFSIPLISNIQLAQLFVESISRKGIDDLLIKSWDEY